MNSSRARDVVLILIVASGLASCVGKRAWHNAAANQGSGSGTCEVSDEEAAGLNGDVSADVNAVSIYKETVAHILKEDQFGNVDCLASRARSNKERFSGGAWKLHELYKATSQPAQYPMHSTDEDWESLLQRLQRWETADPKSITAHVALAEGYVGYAANARGNGADNTVSESGWKLIAERTGHAKKILESARSLPAKDPEWYAAMLEVAELQHWSEAKRRSLFRKANKFEPDYYYYTSVVARSLLPKRTGAPDAAARYIQKVADQVGGERGDILYFQVVTDLPLHCRCEPFDDPHLDLERIGRGFESSERHYGVSLVDLNQVAFMAVRSHPGDEILADKAFRRIGNQWDEATWGIEEDFELAKNFATYRGGRLSIEKAANDNMKTAEGLRYRAAFEEPYFELARQCAKPGDGEFGKFKALTNVGAYGTIEDVRVEGNNPAASCLYQKLRSLQRENAMRFPAPPKAPYWVGLELDWAEFAPK